MVKLYNDWIIVTKDDSSFFPLSINLTFTEPRHSYRVKGRTIDVPETTYKLYTIDDEMMIIPSGYLFLISEYFSNSNLIDMRHRSVYNETDEIVKNIENYRDILPGISLHDDQIEALKEILSNYRCIAQLSTGAGKTEILCALVKILSTINGVYPTTVVMEPTLKLVTDTISRFEGYGIPVVRYGDNRKIVENTVNICHPISLGNDIKKDSELLNNVDILLGDECHHFQSDSFRTPTYHMSNLSYSVGVSASAISQEHVNSKNISDYTYGELLTIGATGKLVINATAGSLIDSGKLANPVLFVVHNPANEPLSERDIANWHKVCSIRLESENRTRLIASAAEFFHMKNRKSLILVNTRRWAQSIMKVLDEYGLSDYTRSSFGGGYFEKYEDGEFVKDTDNVFSKYNNGEYTILIGTSHLYEGADIPNLDAVILAYGGKGERLQIQGLGRVLRKTKSGKYAYIVDFTDSGDIILSKHSRIRMERYRSIINIPEDRIFFSISIRDFQKIFDKLEDGS